MAAEGFVHLDVKPSNIVMGVPPRLLDLSIARSLERTAQLRHSIGTDAYMPSEQCDTAAWPGCGRGRHSRVEHCRRPDIREGQPRGCALLPQSCHGCVQHPEHGNRDWRLREICGRDWRL